jgi:single-stranded-DNA-specific exonuclease
MHVSGWRLSEVDEALVDALAAELRLRPATARVLVVRGLVTASTVGTFLAPRLADLRPPTGIADLGRVLDRLVLALAERQRIGVFGDYDVDGVTSAAVLTEGLRALGGDVIPRVATRQSGYGLPPEMVERFADEGVRLIVTGDCGTSDVPALLRARERGVDVVVIDHHQVPSGERLAFGLVNPHQPEDRFPFKGLASCGIAFYLMASLRSRLRSTAFDPRELLDLVALGTIADLVPLVEENRILVSVGLRVLSARKRPGIRALIDLAKLSDEPAISATQASFRLTPRLNAAGRLGDAQLALDLLLAPDDAAAVRLATALDDVNRERQRIQEGVWGEALVAAEAWTHTPAIVVGGQGWHHGVVGIIASRLVDRFGKPAVVIGFEGAVGRASARTTGGVNLYETLSATAEHLIRFGGHAGAAGLTVSFENLDRFRTAFLSEVGRRQGAAPAGAGRAVVEVDAVVELHEIDVSFAEELERLAPYGAGNQEPLLALRGVVTAGTRIVGQGHLQLSLTGGRARGDAIGFNMAEQDPGPGAAVDLLAHTDVDTFRGSRRARLRVRHLLRSRGGVTAEVFETDAPRVGVAAAILAE